MSKEYEEIRIAAASAYALYSKEMTEVNNMYKRLCEAALLRLQEEFEAFLKQLKEQDNAK